MGMKGFAEGGIASIVAGCTTHPLDLFKVRMQLQSSTHSPVSVAVKIVRQEGVAGLFSGISGTILRATLYSTTRMGLYDLLKNQWSKPNTANDLNSNARILSLPRKISAGLLAGGVGAAVGNPADVAMVRMQADGRLPTGQRRNYTSVGDAIAKMCREEGVVSLWRGSSLTVNRAMVVTASQLASYDQFKEMILAKGVMEDGLWTHVTASFAAGFVASVASNPIDVIKTRVMNMKVEVGKTPPYAGAFDCAVQTVKKEGPMALYKGFLPTISRQGPFTVVLFVTLEQVRKIFKNI